jgi:hypothetical protein
VQQIRAQISQLFKQNLFRHDAVKHRSNFCCLVIIAELDEPVIQIPTLVASLANSGIQEKFIEVPHRKASFRMLGVPSNKEARLSGATIKTFAMLQTHNTKKC